MVQLVTARTKNGGVLQRWARNDRDVYYRTRRDALEGRRGVTGQVMINRVFRRQRQPGSPIVDYWLRTADGRLKVRCPHKEWPEGGFGCIPCLRETYPGQYPEDS